MSNWLVAAGLAALSLFSFFIFPGHTYLTQDTQIYVAILENLWDSTALTRDLLVGHSHVAYTLYDEYAIALRWLTHSNFQAVLQGTQIVCRALGAWGFYLLALRMLGDRRQAVLVAFLCAAGAEISGPAVLLVEYEPSPRSFAVPLLFLALGLAVHNRMRVSAMVATIGFVFHPTSAAPYWLCLLLWKQWRLAAVSLATGLALLGVGAHFQPQLGEHQTLFSRVPPALEAIQRMRGAYNWIGLWWSAEWKRYSALTAISLVAFWRSTRTQAASTEFTLRSILIGLPLAGLLSVPVSYLLLDYWKWSAVPLIQPARYLLFSVAFYVFLCAIAGFQASRWWESLLWFALAAVPAILAPRPRTVPSAALTQLSQWATVNTPKDAVFLFPKAGKSLEPGLFRSQALRAIYVDWKGGGQANFLPTFGLEWWRRYQDVMQKPQSLEHYRKLGIDYVVLPGNPYRVEKVP